MQDTPTVGATLLKQTVTYLKNTGYGSPPTSLELPSLGPDEQYGQRRHPFDHVLSFYQDLARSVAPSFAIQLGAQGLDEGALEVAGFLARTQDTLGAAFDVLQSFRPLFNEASGLDLVRGGGAVRLIVGHDARGQALPWLWAESETALILCLARRWTAGAFQPREVTFRHEARSGTPWMHWSPCPVRFGATVTSITMAWGELERPLSSAMPQLREILLARAQQDLAQRDDTSWLARLREEVARAMVGARPDAGQTARRLGLSKRTLQRRLKGRGLSFQSVVDGVRRSQIKPLLSEPSLSLEAIAWRLGFADCRSLRRATQRWLGASPGDWRSRHGV
jgi:AraC-like DNA-binding protein